MNILLVTYSVKGGAGKACFRLLEALKETGNEVKLLVVEGGTGNNEDVVALYRSSGTLYLKQLFSRYKVLWEQFLWKTKNSNYRAPKSIHNIVDHPLVKWADVINLHWVPELIDYKRFFRRVQKPVVWTMHDMLPFSGGFHYRMERSSINEKVEYHIQSAKEKAVKGKNIRIVAPSQWLLDVSIEFSTFQGFHHQRIFNPLPLKIYKPLNKVFAREALSLPQDKKILVFVADSISSERKGMKILISALQKLGNESNLCLISIGKGRIKEELPVQYIHLGILSDDLTISLLYSAADLTVLPSQEDNSPNVIIESLSCSCPVVAFQIGGIPELVCNENMGRLTTTAEDLHTVIHEALNAGFDREKIRKFAIDNFEYKAVAKQYLKEYNSFF